MNSKQQVLLATLTISLAAVFSGCGSSPKILVDHSFRGTTKTSKLVLQKSNEKAEDKELYNASIVLCDLKGTKESSCKETLVLPNVISQSVY